MEKKICEEKDPDDYITLSLYIDKAIELLDKNIIDYQSE